MVRKEGGWLKEMRTLSLCFEVLKYLVRWAIKLKENKEVKLYRKSEI